MECLLEYQEEVLLADVTITEILTVIISINTIVQVHVCRTADRSVSSNMHLGAKHSFMYDVIGTLSDKGQANLTLIKKCQNLLHIFLYIHDKMMNFVNIRI